MCTGKYSIEVEASERIGAGRYERTEGRVTKRNGSRPRLLAKQAGDVQLRIPKLRKGSFFPVILEPRRRSIKYCGGDGGLRQLGSARQLRI